MCITIYACGSAGSIIWTEQEDVALDGDNHDTAGAGSQTIILQMTSLKISRCRSRGNVANARATDSTTFVARDRFGAGRKAAPDRVKRPSW